jgi:hypothetical protein
MEKTKPNLSFAEIARKGAIDSRTSRVSAAADDFLKSSVKSIDAQFGKGYAEKHPELVAAFMQSCSKMFGVTNLK